MKTNIQDKLQKIDKDYFSLLVDIGKVAEKENQKAYLVGGMVRDLLLGFDNLDIDIVVETNASLLSEALVKKFTNCELSSKHDRFHTAKLIFNINSKKIPIDLASAREEIYEYSAALPSVKVSDLKRDLYRRDFTINALAISLMPGEFGEVVDLFDGFVDLKNKKIRVLHDLSFIDDPTRMIRAIRFAAKLNFEIEENTKTLLKKAIDSGQFDNLIEQIRGNRVKIEIRYLFNLPNIEKAIERFFSSEVYRVVSTKLKPDVINRVSTNNASNQWLIYLALIMKDLNPETQEKIIKNLQLTADETKIIKNGLATSNKLQEIISKNQKIDSIIVYKELKNLSAESILIIKSIFEKDPDVKSLIDEYINEISKIKLEITGQDLISMGVSEGKKIGELLEKILEAKIKNPDMSKEDEIRELEKLIKIYKQAT